MQNNNIIVSCGGRWVGIVLQFKQAMQQLPQFQHGKLYVTDQSAITPAGCFADGSFIVPRIKSDSYIEEMLRVCEQHRIGVVIPLIDIDVVRLAPHRAAFARIGTTIVSPEPGLVEMCFDKEQFEQFTVRRGLPYPRTYAAAEITRDHLPLFIKHRRGYGSIGARPVYTMSDFENALKEYDDLIFQELIDAPEISVDAYVDRNGRCTVRVPRVRQKVIGGEAIQSQTIRNSAVAALADCTIQSLFEEGLYGPMNIQLFASEHPVLIEVNSRIGSASVLSNMATGGRFYRHILEEALGSEVFGSPDDYKENMHIYRFLGDVFHDGTSPAGIYPTPEQRP